MFIPTSFTAAFRRAALAMCALALLAACSSDKPVPPCPQVRVDNTTAALTKFRDGSGRDLTDVEYEVRLVGYQGVCKFGDKGVDVSMDLVMEVASGPAAKPGPTPIYYFVALPQFFPEPAGKRIMVVNHDLEAGAGRKARIEEHGVHAFIPLKKEEPGAAYDVYVGLQLDQDQLDYNRSQQEKK
ncbi:MAG: hypothetical protein EPO08_12710 [Rhodospirillaceae bacterium]|nr:MAG: hypothetical protein EPO08_12710 [Rhodospirillaceae bacterium]